LSGDYEKRERGVRRADEAAPWLALALVLLFAYLIARRLLA